jgi:hypothetical protein
VTTATALAGRVIFKKFNQLAALGAIYLKNRTGLPVLCILSWTFHFYIFLILQAKRLFK